MRELPANLFELPLSTRAKMALEDAVEKVIDEHIRRNLPIYIWREGKVAEIPPHELSDLHPDLSKR